MNERMNIPLSSLTVHRFAAYHHYCMIQNTNTY